MIEPLAIDASSLANIREQKPNSNARDRLALVRQENRILAEPSFERQHAEPEEAVSEKRQEKLVLTLNLFCEPMP